MKCWYSLSINAQGSRLIIIVVHIGAVKIYVASLEAAIRKKERQDETQCTVLPKLGGKFSLDPSYFVL
jgi:hypothetical protein